MMDAVEEQEAGKGQKMAARERERENERGRAEDEWEVRTEGVQIAETNGR